jgi:uncharacterized protein YecE (DUF72 family)
MSLLIGTSGWSYKEWVGPFYEKKTGMFSYYSKFFHTTEINSTFYRYPSEGMIIGLLRYSPPGFVFAAKLPKLITHDKWLNVDEGVENDTHRFLSLIRPLAERLGPILIQLRPKFNFDEHVGDLENYLDLIPKNFEWAVEFRHNSWLREDTYDILSKNNIAYTIVDEPLLPPDLHTTADFAYIRWHGHGTQLWYDYEYSEDQLNQWTPKVKEITSKVRRTYGYFNNHFNANAVKNAVEMLEILGQASPEQKIIHEKITTFRGKSKLRGIQPLESFSISNDNLSVADHILHFTDSGRINRGEKIRNSELNISFKSDSQITADIRDYYIDLDLTQQIIKHNCDDWRKGMSKKRFCKHLVKFFMTLPSKQSTLLLSQIWGDIESWRFEE